MTPLKGNNKTNAPAGAAQIFFMDLSTGDIRSADPSGKNLKTILHGQNHPDGIVADETNGHLYWTNMGNPAADDGTILRADMDGANVTTIVPASSTFTPKQIQIENASGKLYWCDREGMRVMRCNLDGSDVETLVQTGSGDADRRIQTNWCVGIALDSDRKHIYWTQKGNDNGNDGRIFRAGMDLPAGESPEKRTDIELLFENLPEPIDLDIDPAARNLYWTDRGDPPLGNTVSRASMDLAAQSGTAPEILVTHLMEGIGLALDLQGKRMFFTDLGGSVYSADLDGKNLQVLLPAQGNLSGITYVPS